MPGGSPGIPGWFIAIFVIAALVGVGTSIWRYSVLRRGGLNPLVAREQLEARLNQSLTTPPAPPMPAPPPPPMAAPPPPPAPARSIEQRLAELGDLHARGVITDDELAAGRAKIIAGD
jgi:hypothetical protein